MDKVSSTHELCQKAYDNFNGEPTIQNVRITHIPDKPPIHEIENYGEPIKNMRFHRFELPEIIDIEDKENDDIQHIFDQGERMEGKTFEEKLEMDTEFCRQLNYKFKNGHWFFNYNEWTEEPELVYIAGIHYFYLNVWQMKVTDIIDGVRRKKMTFPYYVDIDREFFLFWRQAEIDPKCFGVIKITSRRTGKTHKALNISYRTAITVRDYMNGIMAQSNKMAKSIYLRLIQAWKKMPEHVFLKPLDEGDSSPQSALNFKAPKKRNTKNKYKQYSDEVGSSIEHRSTKATAFDSEDLAFIYIDEGSKWETENVEHTYYVIKETLADGAFSTGKCLMTSTTENLKGKTLEPFKNLYEDSNVKDMGELGQTKTGLWSYFIPAYLGYRYDAEEDGQLPKELIGRTIDDYGNSNKELAIRVHNALRDRLTGDNLIHQKRKYPFTIEEALYMKTDQSPFPLQYVYEQKKHNFKMPTSPVSRGNFEWQNGNRESGIVEWYPREDGKWYKAYDLPPEDRNRNRLVNGQYEPTRDYCVTGCDPISHAGGEGSRTCIITGLRSHPQTELRNATVCLYYHRPSNPNEFFEDIIKQVVYYSSPLNIEQNVYDPVNYMKKRGYERYAIFDPLKPKPSQNARNVKRGFSSTPLNNREALMNAGSIFIHENFGYKKETDTIGFHHFPELIEDLIKFEADNWTKYDITVGFMFMALAMMNLNKKYQGEKQSMWKPEDFYPTSSGKPKIRFS